MLEKFVCPNCHKQVSPLNTVYELQEGVTKISCSACKKGVGVKVISEEDMRAKEVCRVLQLAGGAFNDSITQKQVEKQTKKIWGIRIVTCNEHNNPPELVAQCKLCVDIIDSEGICTRYTISSSGIRAAVQEDCEHLTQ